ncbi:hypothetical protein G6F37_004458 [Rhizopus arrhizus]|nr:hypothetical protein G6F38_002492 [Rhizopus arrhizus]KAG1159909.1 hypothetical protein G6F37_004458 [Rhizopus arrhizus]
MSQYQFIPPPQTTSVIPIVAPSSENSNSIKEYKPISKASNSNSGKRLCRNIIIHGYCKFENKGCEFNHDTSKSIVLPQQQNPLSPENRHTPLADNIHAPVFVPSSTATTQDNTSTSRDPSYRYSAPPSSNSNSTSGNQFHPFNLNPHVNNI